MSGSSTTHHNVHPVIATPQPSLSTVSVPGYQVLEELGRGGMGVVYKARQIGLNRIVALKMLRSGMQAEAIELARFRAEAEAVAALQHPNIVQIFEVGEYNGVPFFSLEYVEGGNLAQKLKGTPQQPRFAAQLSVVLARAIHAAHERGIIHRDLKPGNVLLQNIESQLQKEDPTSGSTYGQLKSAICKITDFGLAKRLEDQGGQTQTGVVVGTPTYMAPEQASGKTDAIGPATDVYALGVILYEMLTGRPPFQGETSFDTLWQVAHQDPVPPRQQQPRVPRDLETVCLRCLRKLPAQRYTSAAALADDLQRFLSGLPVQARAVGVGERLFLWIRRQPAAAGVAGAAVLATLAGTTAFTMDRPVVALLSLIVPVVVSSFGGLTWQWQRARVEKRLAEEQRQQAEAARHESETAHREAEAARREAEAQARKAAAALSGAEETMYSLQIALAEREMRAANIAGAEGLLDACDPGKRHWEWFYLKRLCHTERATLAGAALPLLQVVWSPDGQELAAAGWDHKVHVWEMEKGQEVQVLAGHERQITALAYHPNGRLLASAGGDQVILLWDVLTGQRLSALRGHQHSVLSVAFSPDGRRLASAGADQLVKLWDARTGKEGYVMRGHSREINSLAFSPDGWQLASAGADQVVKLWDVGNGQEIRTLSGHSGPVLTVAFSPDGRCLASAGEDRTVRLWEIETGQTLNVLRGHAGAILGLSFRSDGQYLASAGWDRIIKVWNTQTGTEVTALRGHSGIVTSVAFHGDGRQLASASEDRTVKLWDLVAAGESRTLSGQKSGILEVAVSGDGRRLFSRGARLPGGDPGELLLWDLHSHQSLGGLDNPGPVCGLACSPDGKQVALARTDGLLSLRTFESGETVFEIRAHAGAVTGVAFSPDAGLIATAGMDGMAFLWNAATGRQFRALRTEFPIGGLAWSGDSRQIALIRRDPIRSGGEVHFWSLESGCLTGSVSSETPVTAAAFSPDGRRLATAHPDAAVRLWDPTGGNYIPLLGHQGEVAAVAFSCDGRRVVSASHDETVKLWDANTGREFITLRGHTREVTAVAFDPNSKRLFSGSMDQTIQIWET
jgi:WD40 repeat protein/tRNA A-37 threonylcarbamoyl transferase component Bud32